MKTCFNIEIWNAELLCIHFYRNTGGLGGAFGYFYGVGKPLPIPECQPYKPSFRFRMLNKIGALLKKLQKNKKE